MIIIKQNNEKNNYKKKNFEELCNRKHLQRTIFSSFDFLLDSFFVYCIFQVNTLEFLIQYPPLTNSIHEVCCS